MKPVEPNPIGAGGKLVTYASDQPEYEPLIARVYAGGIVCTKWQLSFDERRAILDGACVELLIWTFGQPLQPVLMRVEGVRATDEAEIEDRAAQARGER